MLENITPRYDEQTGKLSCVEEKDTRKQYAANEGNRHFRKVMAEWEGLEDGDPLKFPMRIDPVAPDPKEEAANFYAAMNNRVIARVLHLLNPLWTPEKIKAAFDRGHEAESKERKK